MDSADSNRPPPWHSVTHSKVNGILQISALSKDSPQLSSKTRKVQQKGHYNQLCLLERRTKLVLCSVLRSGRWVFCPCSTCKLQLEQLTALLPTEPRTFQSESVRERKTPPHPLNINLTFTAPLKHFNEGAQTSHVLDKRYPALHWKTLCSSQVYITADNARHCTSDPYEE